ncbi:MAG: DNA translocase FtsK [Clostridia bacterium]
MSYNNPYNDSRYESTANRIAVGVLIIIVSLLATLSLCNALSSVGHLVKDFLLGVFGFVAYAYSICGVIIGVAVTLGRKPTLPLDKSLKYILLFILGVMIFHVWFTRGLIAGSNYGQYLKTVYVETSPAGWIGSLISYPIMKILSPTFFLVVLIILFAATALASFYPLLVGSSPYKAKNTKIKPNKSKTPVLADISREAENETVISNEVGNSLFVGTVNEDGSAAEFKQASKKQIKKQTGFNVLFPNQNSATNIEDSAVEPIFDNESERKKRAREKLFGKKTVETNNTENVDDKVVFGKSLEKQPVDDVKPSHKEVPRASLPFTFNTQINQTENRDGKPKSLKEAFNIDDTDEGRIRELQERMGYILNSEVKPSDVRGAASKRLVEPIKKPEPEVLPEVKQDVVSKSNDDTAQKNDDLPYFVKQILYGEQKNVDIKKVSDINSAELPDNGKTLEKPLSPQNLDETIKPSFKPIPQQPARPIVESVLYSSAQKDAALLNDKLNKQQNDCNVVSNNEVAPLDKINPSFEYKPLDEIKPIIESPSLEKPADSGRGSIRDLNIFKNNSASVSEKPSVIPQNPSKSNEDVVALGDFSNLNNERIISENKNSAIMPSEKTVREVENNPLDRQPRTEAKRIIDDKTVVREDRLKSNEQLQNTELQKEKPSSYNNDFPIGKRAEPVKLTPAPAKIKAEQISIEQSLEEQRLRTPYMAPPIDLLMSRDEKVKIEDYTERVELLEHTLSQFKIDAKVIGVTQGPTFSRFELMMPDGIPVNSVLKIEKDLSMKLRASPLRFEAPIPGRDAFGIEVPNAVRSAVSLKSIIMSEEFNTAKSMLTFALGKDIGNDNFVCDLESMPHMLIAGATGSGKSVCINSLIVSLLYKCGPNDLKLILVDPKQVELNLYSGLPHLLLPEVIDDPVVAINALDWTIEEMKARFTIFKKYQVRNISEYNSIAAKTPGLNKIPRIVFIIDELADFILVKKKEIEDRIGKVTRLSRAAGIHLVVATQRPSVDIVTGTIKSNLPSRIAFAVQSAADSMTILAGGGAENLLGKGDMLFAPQSRPEPIRLQCTLVERDEVKAVVDYIKAHNECYYDSQVANSIYSLPKEDIAPDDVPSTNNNKTGDDKLFVDALRMFVNEKQASISKLQRRFKVGYGTAANIMEKMEDRKYVSANLGGNKTREVLISLEQFYQIFGRDDDEDITNEL